MFDTVAYPFYDAKREKWDAFEAEPKSTVRSDCATRANPRKSLRPEGLSYRVDSDWWSKISSFAASQYCFLPDQ